MLLSTHYISNSLFINKGYPPFGSVKPNRSVNLGEYRFGFNGQERTDELSGVGNHTTATFWEYNTRLGRRWNLDPVDQISISNYAVFKNNPLLFVDPDGDKPDGYKDGQGNYAWFENKHSSSFTDDNGTNWSKVTANKGEWNQATKIRNANIKGLTDLGFDESQSKMDVNMYDENNILFTKGSRLDNAESYTKDWKDKLNLSTFSVESKESNKPLSNTSYNLKWYPNKGGQKGASFLGLVKSGYISHIVEAALESIEYKVDQFMKKNIHPWISYDDQLIDMHFDNANYFLQDE